LRAKPDVAIQYMPQLMVNHEIQCEHRQGAGIRLSIGNDTVRLIGRRVPSAIAAYTWIATEQTLPNRFLIQTSHEFALQFPCSGDGDANEILLAFRERRRFRPWIVHYVIVDKIEI
jgi:hypothetical protein